MKPDQSDLRVDEPLGKPSVRGLHLGARIRRFVDGREGAALIEYALLVLLLAALCIVAMQSIGSKVSNGFNSANSMIP